MGNVNIKKYIHLKYSTIIKLHKINISYNKINKNKVLNIFFVPLNKFFNFIL